MARIAEVGVQVSPLNPGSWDVGRRVDEGDLGYLRIIASLGSERRGRDVVR